MVLYTVGHGTLAAEAFVALLHDAGAGAVVDIRRFPSSRRHPHFRREAMAEWLPANGLGYRWEERLGGRRSRRSDSPNTALRNAQFRGYADHMRTPAFQSALEAVLAEAGQRPTAVLCAESVWWRCHRRLVADAAVLQHDTAVRHLFHDGRADAHTPTAEARVGADGLVVYDRSAEPRLPGLD